MNQPMLPGMERLTRPGLDNVLTQVELHEKRLDRPVLLVPGWAPLEPGGPGELASYDGTNDAGEPQAHGMFGFVKQAADAAILYSLNLAPQRTSGHRLRAHITRREGDVPFIDLMAQHPEWVYGAFLSGERILKGTTYIVDSKGWLPCDDDSKGAELGLPMQYWHEKIGGVAILGSHSVTADDLVGVVRRVSDPWTEHIPKQAEITTESGLQASLANNIKTTIT